MEATNDGFTPHELVCTGACTLVGGKKGVNFRLIETDGSLGTDFALERTKAKIATAGAVYSAPMNADRSKIRVDGLRWARPYGDTDQVTFWKLQEDALMAREREQSMAKQGKTIALAEAMKALEPIRLAHRSTDRWGKVVIEALVLQYVRGF